MTCMVPRTGNGPGTGTGRVPACRSPRSRRSRPPLPWRTRPGQPARCRRTWPPCRPRSAARSRRHRRPAGKTPAGCRRPGSRRGWSCSGTGYSTGAVRVAAANASVRPSFSQDTLKVPGPVGDKGRPARSRSAVPAPWPASRSAASGRGDCLLARRWLLRRRERRGCGRRATRPPLTTVLVRRVRRSGRGSAWPAGARRGSGGARTRCLHGLPPHSSVNLSQTGRSRGPRAPRTKVARRRGRDVVEEHVVRRRLKVASCLPVLVSPGTRSAPARRWAGRGVVNRDVVAGKAAECDVARAAIPPRRRGCS